MLARPRGKSPLVALCCAALVAGACEGQIATAEPPAAAPLPAGPRAPGPPNPAGIAPPRIDARHGAIGLRRLSRQEYGNTIADLLGVKGAESDIGDDDAIGFLSNNQHAGRVGLAELEAYERAAAKIAAQAIGPAPAAQATSGLGLPTGCTADAPSSACVAKFLPDFLLRAFRRPPTLAEQQRYAGLFAKLAATGEPGDALRGVLQAVLMSPSFLYRTELGDGRTLSSFEIASRLSYFLWGTMPDGALFERARVDGLRTPAGLEPQLRRMLADPRAERGILNIVYEWLGLHGAQIAKKGRDVQMGLPAGLQAAIEGETRRFVADALLGPSGGLAALYGARHSFLDETVAALYGVKGVTGKEFRKVALDAATRRGLFTQPLVLTAHTKESGYSVVQMGRFVRERLLCQLVPPPPPGADTELHETPATANLTYREKFSKHASDDSCRGCHVTLDPPGFAYLPYDPVGRFRPGDPNGVPFDTRGTLLGIEGGEPPFANAVEMLDAVAASPDARGCFARKFTEYAFGRALAEADVPLYGRLVRKLEGEGRFAAFLAELVLAKEFVERGPDEVK